VGIIERWLSVLGAVASISAAVYAVYQAKLSSESASKAEKARNEIIEKRKTVEISQVHAETKRVLNVVSKVGPSCNSTLLRGVNCATIAKEVEEYSRFLNEQSAHFNDFFQNKARDLCSALNSDIEALSEAKDFESKKAAGKTIYYKINGFMPSVKLLADEKRERITN